MNTVKISKQDVYRLCRAVKQDICDEYHAFEDDDYPGIQLTVACGDDGGKNGNWSYQTGDNSYTGGAYSYPHWAVVGIYRTSNCKQIADDILNQLSDLISN